MKRSYEFDEEYKSKRRKLTKLDIHPRNYGHLTFNEKFHVYRIDGRKVAYSVSKFISKFCGKFDRIGKAQQIVDRNLSANSVYHKMTVEDILKFWDRRRDDGTFLHNLIEDYIKYGIMFTDRNSKFYKDFAKFLKFYDDLRKDGWINFHAEMQIYSDKPFMGGMVDLIVYRKVGNKYEYMVIDWKRSRRPDFVDESKTLDYIIVENDGEIITCSEDKADEITEFKRKFKSPLEGRHSSTHLKHSLQLFTYVYMLEKYYSKDYFLFQPEQLKKVANVYFHDSYDSYLMKECIDVRKEVKLMFEIVNKGLI